MRQCKTLRMTSLALNVNSEPSILGDVSLDAGMRCLKRPLELTGLLLVTRTKSSPNTCIVKQSPPEDGIAQTTHHARVAACSPVGACARLERCSACAVVGTPVHAASITAAKQRRRQSSKGRVRH